MKNEQIQFYSLLHWPLMVDNVKAGWILGLETHEVDIAANAGNLRVLGGARNGEKKLFATADLQALSSEDLSKIRRTVILYWRKKNASRRATRKTETRPAPPSLKVMPKADEQKSLNL